MKGKTKRRSEAEDFSRASRVLFSFPFILQIEPTSNGARVLKKLRNRRSQSDGRQLNGAAGRRTTKFELK